VKIRAPDRGHPSKFWFFDSLVGWQRQRANAKPYLIRRFRFAIGAEIQNHFLAVALFKV